MSINQRQFDQLTEMGISLWQHRSSQRSIPAHSIESTASVDSVQSNAISLNELSQMTLFNDIILSLNISIGEITEQQGLLNLGLINWRFLSDQKTNDSNDKPEITFDNSQLQTPTLDVLSSSTRLKRQLWHIITNKIL